MTAAPLPSLVNHFGAYRPEGSEQEILRITCDEADNEGVVLVMDEDTVGDPDDCAYLHYGDDPANDFLCLSAEKCFMLGQALMMAGAKLFANGARLSDTEFLNRMDAVLLGNE